MTETQKDTFSRRDFARLTATGLGAFAISDVLFRVFRVGGNAAQACCEGCDGGPCDNQCENPCDACDACDACDVAECFPCDPEAM